MLIFFQRPVTVARRIVEQRDEIPARSHRFRASAPAVLS